MTTVQFKSKEGMTTVYDVVTNYSFTVLMELCRKDLGKGAITAGELVEWAVKNNYYKKADA